MSTTTTTKIYCFNDHFSENPLAAYTYATLIIKAPFPAGEPAIYSDAELSAQYNEFLKSLETNGESHGH